MGCWNSTCMISNLPIMPGEKIKIIFLGNKHLNNYESVINRSAYTNVDDILCPITLAITGEYNYYGTIENCTKDWNYNFIESEMKKQFGPIRVQFEGTKENWTLLDIIKGIERGTIETNVNDEWYPLNLSWVMIREDIWNFAIEIEDLKAYSWDKNTIGETIKSKFFGSLDRLKAHTEYFKKLIEWCKSGEPKDSKPTYVSSEDINPFLELPVYSVTGKKLDHLVDYTDYMRLSIKNDAIIQEIYKGWSELEYIKYLLNGVRKGWMIQPGAGSQNDDWDYNKLLAQKIINICDEKINESYEEE